MDVVTHIAVLVFVCNYNHSHSLIVRYRAILLIPSSPLCYRGLQNRFPFGFPSIENVKFHDIIYVKMGKRRIFFKSNGNALCPSRCDVRGGKGKRIQMEWENDDEKVLKDNIKVYVQRVASLFFMENDNNIRKHQLSMIKSIGRSSLDDFVLRPSSFLSHSPSLFVSLFHIIKISLVSKWKCAILIINFEWLSWRMLWSDSYNLVIYVDGLNILLAFCLFTRFRVLIVLILDQIAVASLIKIYWII